MLDHTAIAWLKRPLICWSCGNATHAGFTPRTGVRDRHRRFLPIVVPKRDTRLWSRVQPDLVNTFSGSQLGLKPKAVRALLRKTAVTQLIAPGAEVA